jgi:hypothetical protein
MEFTYLWPPWLSGSYHLRSGDVHFSEAAGPRPPEADADAMAVELGLYPIVTSQYSSTTLYQISYHIQYLFF